MCTQKKRIIIFEVRDSARVRERDERCHAQGWSRHTYASLSDSPDFLALLLCLCGGVCRTPNASQELSLIQGEERTNASVDK